jgi:ribonuclease R
MILANELVAQWLGKKRVPTVYRVHGRPDEQKLERLAEVARRLGAPVDLSDLLEPTGVSRWIGRVAEHPRRNVLEMVLLRSLKQAVYDIVNIGHFGLASGDYLHFTSPIRRYPDIVVHRAVKALLRGSKPDVSTAAVQKLKSSAADSSVRERAAMDVEREVVDLHRCLLMRDRIGDTFEGMVTGVTASGVYVSLDDPFVDVLVRYDALGPDRYELDDDELGVVGSTTGDRIQLGDRIAVGVDDVAVLRRSIYGHRVVPEHLSGRASGRRSPASPGRPGSRPDRRQKARKKASAGQSGAASDRAGTGERRDDGRGPRRPKRNGRPKRRR